MKRLIAILVGLFFGLTLSAQVPQAFKYQAIARDNSGNVLANKVVSFKISILGGHAAGEVVYSETHSGKTTNAFGLVELEVGKGMPITGNFVNIPWAANIHFLKVEMDPNGGTAFQAMGASQLVSVPYAQLARYVENNNDLDPDPGNEIQLLSINGTQVSLSRGGGTIQMPVLAGGPFSSNGGTTSNTPLTDNFVFGSSSLNNVTGSADNSRFFFNKAKSAFRAGTVAESALWDDANVGFYSVAMGYGTTASNYDTFAFGSGSKATGNGSVAIGNQLTVSGSNAVSFGSQNEAAGDNSTAFGLQNKTSGMNSTGIGSQGKASGSYSVVIGTQTTALGYNSIAIGSQTTASGTSSFSAGSQTSATGNYSTAMGYQTSASSCREFVVGSSNTTYTPESTTLWKPNDRLFVVGNGEGNSVNSDAMVILKNGNVGIGTSAPTHPLDVNGVARIRGLMTGIVATTVYRTSDGTLITGASDIRLKDNVEPLQNGLGKVMQLNGVTFSWKADPSKKRSIGFIAQEFEKVIPELVFTNETDGYKGINYAEVSAILVEAIKELKTENDLLKARLEKIEGLMGAKAEK